MEFDRISNTVRTAAKVIRMKTTDIHNPQSILEIANDRGKSTLIKNKISVIKMYGIQRFVSAKTIILRKK